MRAHRNQRRAISMAETVVASLLVGLVLTSTLQIVGPIVQSGTVRSNQLVAANLAEEMLEEIAYHDFVDPSPADADAIGLDAGEVSSDRSTFDDIDDYHGWAASPPQRPNGDDLSNLGGWTRRVKVSHVQVNNPASSSSTSTGLKKIQVVVKRDGVTLASMSMLKSEDADAIGLLSGGN